MYLAFEWYHLELERLLQAGGKLFSAGKYVRELYGYQSEVDNATGVTNFHLAGCDDMPLGVSRRRVYMVKNSPIPMNLRGLPT